MKEITKENIIEHLNRVYKALNKRPNQTRGIIVSSPHAKAICDKLLVEKK